MGLCQPDRCGCAIRSTSLRHTGGGTDDNPYLLDTWYQVTPPSARYLTPAVGTAWTPDPGPTPPAGFTICVKVRKNVLNTATAATIAIQGEATPQLSWQLYIHNGALQWRTSANGTNVTYALVLTAAQLDAVMNPNADVELAATLRTTGSNVETRGYYRPTPGGTWFPAATTATTPFTGTLYDSTHHARIGQNNWDGRIYWAEMRTGLDPNAGTVQWRFDADDHPGSGTAYTDPRGDDWYLDTAAITPLPVDAVHGMQTYLPGPNRIQRYDGRGWRTELAATTTYTPTYTNINIGAGATNTASYTITNQVITIQGLLGIGTPTVVGAGIRASLPPGLYPAFTDDPVAAARTVGIRHVGNAVYFDASTGQMHNGSVDASIYDPTHIFFYAAAPTTYTLTASNPFPWAAGDEIWWKITYDLDTPDAPVTPPTPKILGRWDRSNWDDSVWV